MQRHARRVGTVSIGTSSPLPILSPTAQHKCKELMGVEFGYSRSLRSLKTSLRAPTSVALPKQTHAQFSPCKKIMQKWAAPSCQEQLSSHPKKEKLKIPQGELQHGKAAAVPMPPSGCHGLVPTAAGVLYRQHHHVRHPSAPRLLQHGEHKLAER